MKKALSLLLICAALIPQTGLCVTEGVIEEAPLVEMEEAILSGGAADATAYLPDASYYAGDNDVDVQPAWGASEEYVEPQFDGENFYPAFQGPRLSSGEIARAQKLLEAYRNGEVSGDGGSVLEKTENVIVGVYALDPAEFDGETVYVLLPNVNLTDEQLLAIIDAYHQLGLEFDPSALSYRNCARGGGIECSRFTTEDEQERRTRINWLIRRGIAKPEGERSDARRAGRLSLDARYFNGMDSFCLRPYRRLTDEEIMADLIAAGVHDESGEYDVDAIERNARALLMERLGCPLSMEVTGISREAGYLPTTFDAQGMKGYVEPARSMYVASFTYRDEATGYPAYADIACDQETDTLFAASFLIDYAVGRGMAGECIDEPSILSEDEYIACAAAFAKAGGWDEALAWNRAEEIWAQGSRCEQLRARTPDGQWLTVYLDPTTGAIHGAELANDMLLALELEDEENIIWQNEMGKSNG